jgi:hypothetical protein
MKLDLEFNVDTLRISSLDEEDSYNNGASTQSAGSALLNSIKQRSQVIDASTGEIDPTAGLAVPKIRAEVGSSKLRDLLNNLDNKDEL